MRIHIIAVGSRIAAWQEQAITEYIRRCGRDLPIRITPVKPARRGPSATTARLLELEAKRIRALLPPDTRCIVLDEKGREFNTADLSRYLARWRREGCDVSILIGGADGLDPELRAAADETWSLSRLTLPHGLARVVLAEQLYRAWTMLQGHPYHRE